MMNTRHSELNPESLLGFTNTLFIQEYPECPKKIPLGCKFKMMK